MMTRQLFVVSALLCLPASALLTLPLSMKSLDKALVMLQTHMDHAKDSECSDSESVTKDTCLTKSAKCMWMELDNKNLCLPCVWSGINLPCVPFGAAFGGHTVKQCEMQCSHQQTLTKVSSCVDTGGTITQDECFSKGQSAFTSCMWTVYNTALGKKKTLCGPCQVDGVGKIPPYSTGQLGPEAGSTVVVGASMCDLASTNGMPCDEALGIPAVTQCQPGAPPLGPTVGAAPLANFGIKVDKDAPMYYASLVPKPFGPKEYYAASSAAMRAAGWPMGSATLPSAKVVVFGPPPLQGPTLPPGLGAMYGPAPVGIPNIPFPGMGAGTAPPPEKDAPNPPALPAYGTPGGVFIGTRPAVKGDPSFDPTESFLSLKKRITRRFSLHKN